MIRCRCGAHFCWECLQPIGLCDGSCEEDSDNEREPVDPATIDEDDIDGKFNYHEDDDEHDFGPEPYGNAVDAWGCHHLWSTLRPRPDRERSECQLCYRTLVSVPPPTTSPKMDHEGDIMMSGTLPNQWQCAGRHMTCFKCLGHPPLGLVPDTAPYECWCRTQYCHVCDRNETIKELEMGYECRCGMLICGACRDNTDSS